MKRPWQIWILFFGCLMFVIAAMGWLTAKVIQLDKAEIAARNEARIAHMQEAEAFREAELARRQADLQDRVSNALWRMDWTLTPLVAQEAARPYFVYRPFFTANGDPSTGKGKTQRPVDLMPSPLLVPSEFVLLHFQLAPDGVWTSPQNPLDRATSDAAKNYGATSKSLQNGAARLAVIGRSIRHADLLAMLPEQLIEPLPLAANRNNAYAMNFNTLNDDFINNSGKPQVFNDPGIKQAQRQIAQQQVAQQRVAQDEQQQQKPEQRPQQSGRDNPRTRQLRGQYARDRRNLMMRNGITWQSRMRGIQAYAQSSALQQRMVGNGFNSPRQIVKEGVSRPLWFDGKLLLARRTVINKQTVIQGCWLDWPRLKNVLLHEVSDLTLKDADLIPVRDVSISSVGRMLATLPVALKVREPLLTEIPLESSVSDEPPRTRWSAIRASLGLAWICLLVGTGAVAILLQGVVKLSERRGAFVSAVTHELRTPLTTFRMYAEMLSEGMVSSGEQRKKYLETLRQEADRLSHLVENVLQYARLERNRSGRNRQTLTAAKLVERMQQRLIDRAEQAQMTIVRRLDTELEDCVVRTDPAAVEQIVFNIVDNACKYANDADNRSIVLDVTVDTDSLRLAISDHGPGISDKAARLLFKPFSKSVHDAANSAPGVGLGLALCKRLALELKGRLVYTRRVDGGASFTLVLPLGSIRRA